MLHRGAIEPADCSLAELTAVGGTPANTLWPGSPGPCDATTALIRAALSSWSPERHMLYHRGVRSGVRTVLLVAERLRRRHDLVGALPPQQQPHLLPQPSDSLLVELPHELWHVWQLVCSFFLRPDWPI
jgi:hypothetical protein